MGLDASRVLGLLVFGKILGFWHFEGFLGSLRQAWWSISAQHQFPEKAHSRNLQDLKVR